MAPPEKRVSLTWLGRGMVFRGDAAGKPPIALDGETTEGPAPMEALLQALGGCTGSDVVQILGKKRVDLRELRVEIHGVRREEYPRRYTAITLAYHVRAPGATEAAVRQAIDLSLAKYCSVTHSLNPDIALTYELHLQA